MSREWGGGAERRIFVCDDDVETTGAVGHRFRVALNQFSVLCELSSYEMFLLAPEPEPQKRTGSR